MDDDKISRQALLDEINEEIEYGEEHFRPENEQINKGLKIARKLVKAAPSVDNGWISVKDRLPPTGVPVLIYVYNIEEMTVVSLDHDGLGFSNANEWFNIKNIHHWRHLPEPPKGECK